VTPSFEIAATGRVVFGAGRAADLPGLVQGWGSVAFVCTGGRPEDHRELLAALPMPAVVWPVRGEPTVAMAVDAVASARAGSADLVIAIGGGSVLDLGKTVAALLGNGGEPLDYLEVIGRGRPLLAPSVPFAAVPTTAGTGAEVTANAVLASPEHGRKASLRSSFMLPRLALVDPLLTIGCPPAVTAFSGLDALTQNLEPFVSPQATPLTDGYAREGLRRSASGLRAAYLDGTDVRARTDMSLAGLLGGMALTGAKLGAVHGFAGVIGGMVAAPHGAICAALLAPVCEANVRALAERDSSGPALSRYREVAGLLTGTVDAAIADGIDWIRETVSALGAPGLGAWGVRPEMAATIVDATTTASSTKGNPVTLQENELYECLADAME
jgi:alcohol dehydrogenase class IV